MSGDIRTTELRANGIGGGNMFSHVMVGSNDIGRSKRFYDALFEKPAHEDDKGRLAYRKSGAVFMVTSPIDGAPASHANGGLIGHPRGSRCVASSGRGGRRHLL